MFKGKAQIHYLLVLQFVSDCAQHSRLVYRFNICLYLKVHNSIRANIKNICFEGRAY